MNNVALDVFIGLICIYLLYSLLASILMEAVAKYLGLRQRITLKGVYKLLDDCDYSNGWLFSRLWKSLTENRYWNPFADRPFTALFYAHPNIKNIGKNSYNRKPSSITAEMFAETLIEILRGDEFAGQQNQVDMIKKNLRVGLDDFDDKKLPSVLTPFFYSISGYKTVEGKYIYSKDQSPDGKERIKISRQTYYQLRQQLYNSHSDIDWFKKSLITWFNEMMDRTEGWYIKQTRTLLFIIGFAIAAIGNVDTIAIAKRLATDKTARDKMIQFASNISKDPSYAGNKEIKDLSDSALKEALLNSNNSIREARSIIGPSLPEPSWSSIPGWWITAFALSLGASFWFDLLGKIMCIRQGGNNSSTDAQKKVDKTLTNPTEEPVG